MKGKNRSIVLILIGIAIIGGSGAMVQQQEKQERNLKVLPKNISNEELDKIMDEYTDALGVKCSYCHSPSKLKPSELDYANDDMAAKRIARDMMVMTIGINKQFFKDHTDEKGVIKDAISCITCHNGQEYPPSKK